MKKIITLFVMLAAVISAQAQNERDVFSANEITWYGLDFSKAMFVGTADQFGGTSDLKHKFFPAWNEVVVNERDKYDLKKAYNKTSVLYEIDAVTKRNNTLDVDKMITLNAQDGRLTKADVAKVVSGYKAGKKGIGLVYIVESYNKPDEKGVIWVTFFDMASRKVLITEKFVEKPGGFGIRNFWLKPVYETMMKSSHDAYLNWIK